jgi:hypothetical protein
MFRSKAAAGDLGGGIGTGGGSGVRQPLLASARYYRLLVAQWSGVGARDALSLSDAAGLLAIDQDTMRLPLAPAVPLSAATALTAATPGIGALLADRLAAGLPLVLANGGTGGYSGVKPSEAGAEEGAGEEAGAGVPPEPAGGDRRRLAQAHGGEGDSGGGGVDGSLSGVVGACRPRARWRWRWLLATTLRLTARCRGRRRWALCCPTPSRARRCWARLRARARA